MIKRIAAISVLAGTVLAGGGGVAFAAPPPTPHGHGNGAHVTNFTCLGPHGHGVVTPSGNINRECHA